MISYPFESQNTGSASAPVYDRAITAEQERKFNKMRYTNGVFSTPTNGLMVQAKSGMTVTVKAGGCHIEGALGVLEADLDISISASNASQSRIDRIVARFDTSVSVRSVDIYKKEGVLSSNPQPPDIVRESNYYEIVLADIRISAGASEITNANITDQRENSDLCGLVVPAIPTPLDLDDIYLQYQASLDEYLELVATALDETTAGHLQGLIDSLTSRMTAAETKITNIQSDISISEETIAAFKALGWTPPVGGAVIESLLNLIFDRAHPVGSYYWSSDSTNPSKLFGGTWEQVTDKFVLAAGNTYKVGAVGGEAEHKLSIAELPIHYHEIARGSYAGTGYTTSDHPFLRSSGTVGGGNPPIENNNNRTGNMGQGTAHNNMPPYVVAYCWRRTA